MSFLFCRPSVFCWCSRKRSQHYCDELNTVHDLWPISCPIKCDHPLLCRCSSCPVLLYLQWNLRLRMCIITLQMVQQTNTSKANPGLVDDGWNWSAKMTLLRRALLLSTVPHISPSVIRILSGIVLYSVFGVHHDSPPAKAAILRWIISKHSSADTALDPFFAFVVLYHEEFHIALLPVFSFLFNPDSSEPLTTGVSFMDVEGGKGDGIDRSTVVTLYLLTWAIHLSVAFPNYTRNPYSGE